MDDANSEINAGESSQHGYIIDDSSGIYYSSPHILSASCALCHRTLSSNNDHDDVDLEAISVCGDCKFLLLEDLETASPDVYATSRRTRHDSSESIESMFSQQFSQLINLARQNQSMSSVDGDGGAASARLLQHTSSRTTPSGSRRWGRVFSDTESEGFDSLYGGESESNVSFRRYRVFHGEAADTISYTAYGEDSDASVDGAHSFLGNGNFGNPNGESDLESDTDIDPMNAGLYHWNSEEDDSEWEEPADIERNTLESLRDGDHVPGLSRSNRTINWRRQILSPEVEGMVPLSIRERIQTHSGGDSGDYLDARGFENLLERLAETESSRRGAPPASISFVNNMQRITIYEDKPDSMACAICKDSFTVGTIVNQLPCFHLFHPSCILPWLSTRSTCPLCRYELPTDDKDYEARKQNRGREYEARIIHPHDVNYDGSLGAIYDTEVDEPSQREQRELITNGDSDRNDSPRNRWFFLAAPIVSIVGISLMLWFGNPSQDRRCQSDRVPHRRENSQRRWWLIF